MGRVGRPPGLRLPRIYAKTQVEQQVNADGARRPRLRLRRRLRVRKE